MISVLRRLLSSWVAGAILVLITVAVLVTGIGTPGGLGNMSATGDSLATIGNKKISAAEVERHVASRLEVAKRENPLLTMPDFIARGGFDSSYSEYMTAKALEFFGMDQGMVAGKTIVDREIARIDAFKGPEGQFDENTFQNVLAQQKLTVAQFREDLAGAFIRQQLIAPVAGNARMPLGMATSYAALLLEARKGSIGVIPSQMMPQGPAPTEAEIADHYAKTRAAYMVPEQRSLKYALFSAANARGAVPTVAEVAAYYKAHAADYAATERRAMAQVVLPDEAAARAFSAKVKAGQSFEAVAHGAGFAAADTIIGAKSRAEMASISSEAVAAAAFALPRGGISAPIRSELGWHIVRVDAIAVQPGKSLEQARAEIFGTLARQKADEAIIDLVNQIEDRIADGASLDEVAKAHGLTVTTTPLLTATGQTIDGKPAAAPELPILLKAGFAMAEDDEPVVEALAASKSYALLGVDRVVAAAPMPLTKVRAMVEADLKARRAAAAARKVAEGIVSKVNAGNAMAEAFAAAKLPPPEIVGARRIDLSQSRNVPPPIAMMFSMAKGKAKLLPAPDNRGWMVVLVTDIVPGNIAERPELVAQAQAQLQQGLSMEYAQQFATAARTELGFKENKDRVLRLKKKMSGASAE